MDGGCDIRGGQGCLFFLPFLFASSVCAVHPLAQTLGQGQVGGQGVVRVVKCVSVICVTQNQESNQNFIVVLNAK